MLVIYYDTPRCHILLHSTYNIFLHDTAPYAYAATLSAATLRYHGRYVASPKIYEDAKDMPLLTYEEQDSGQ